MRKRCLIFIDTDASSPGTSCGGVRQLPSFCAWIISPSIPSSRGSHAHSVSGWPPPCERRPRTDAGFSPLSRCEHVQQLGGLPAGLWGAGGRSARSGGGRVGRVLRPLCAVSHTLPWGSHPPAVRGAVRFCASPSMTVRFLDNRQPGGCAVLVSSSGPFSAGPGAQTPLCRGASPPPGSCPALAVPSCPRQPLAVAPVW